MRLRHATVWLAIAPATVMAPRTVVTELPATTFVNNVLSLQISSGLSCFIDLPFNEVLKFSHFEVNHGATRDTLLNTGKMLRMLYGQTLSTDCGRGTAFDMIHLGLEDGRFMGYFSNTSATYRAENGTAFELSWWPYTWDSVGKCSACGSEVGKVLSASCATDPRAGQSDWDASACVDSDLRNYYKTSEADGGRFGNYTQWRLYDHRKRPWYIAQKARASNLTSPQMLGWSTVYTFSTSGQLGITATGTIMHAGLVRGVTGVDYELSKISTSIKEVLKGQSLAWAYIVERTGANAGAVVGSTVDPMQTAEGKRLQATDSSNSAVSMSARVLSVAGWPVRTFMAWEGNLTFECSSRIFTGKHRLDWLIVVGQMADCAPTEVLRDGACKTCAPGTMPTQTSSGSLICTTCPRNHAGSGGTCTLCADGQQPSFGQSSCEACPSGFAGVGGHCESCDKLQGELPNAQRTRCVCKAGTYDRRALGPIHCWKHGKRASHDSDSLNEVSADDLLMARRCITCPGCLQCTEPGGDSHILAGFATLHKTTAGAEQALNVYACPSAEGCTAHNVSERDESRCAMSRHGKLCHKCAAGYVSDGEGVCIPCGTERWSRGRWVSTTVTVAFFPLCYLVWQNQPPSVKVKFDFWVKVLEKSWPRFRQSWNIWMSNIQITSAIAVNCEVSWPSGLASIISVCAGLANMDIFSLPGLSCVVDAGFFGWWILRVLLIPLIALALFLSYRISVADLMRAVHAVGDTGASRSEGGRQPAEEWVVRPEHVTQQEDDLVGRHTLSQKMHLAFQIGNLRLRYSTWLFTFVYLLYPSVTRAIFTVFNCRELDDGTSFLHADLSVQCTDSGGGVSSDYVWYLGMSCIACLAIPVGVPAMFCYVLVTNKETLQKNPDYVTICAYKPLFQFYKPQCYLWDIYFMVEKLILVGFMSLIDASLVVRTLNLLISIFFMCAFASQMPSRTQQYNYANILSNAIVVLMFSAALILTDKQTVSGGEGAEVRQRIDIYLMAINLGMMIYLIYISTNNLSKMITQSKIDVTNHLKATDRELMRSGSKEDAEAATAAAFRFFDRDGSGEVDLAEIEFALQRCSITLTPRERQAAIDTANVATKHVCLRADIHELFEETGLDQSAEITVDELHTATRQCQAKALAKYNWHLTDDNIEHLMADIDMGGTGIVTWPEFLKACMLRLRFAEQPLTALRQKAREIPADVLAQLAEAQLRSGGGASAGGGKPYAGETSDELLESTLDSLGGVESREATLSLLTRALVLSFGDLERMALPQLQKVAAKENVNKGLLKALKEQELPDALHRSKLLELIEDQRTCLDAHALKTIWLTDVLIADPQTGGGGTGHDKLEVEDRDRSAKDAVEFGNPVVAS